MGEQNRPFLHRRSSRRQRLVVACLLVAAAISLLVVAMPGGALSVSAQVSPLSPLGAPAVTGGAPISLAPLPRLNVMASGQAGLSRLALLLFGIIVGVSIILWRRP